MIRVLVVDDSAFARKVLRETLAAAPGIEVVDIARDGLEALEKIAMLRPDVVTLDLTMPGLDGVGVMAALPHDDPPRVVLVSVSGRDNAQCVEALQMGAVELVQKPTALATDRLYTLGEALVRAVRAAASARPRLPTLAASPATVAPGARRADVVVVGTSTGGPQALARLLPALPADLPVPVAVALHIPAGYTEALAQRLDAAAQLTVVEADGEVPLRPGLAVLARGGCHLRLTRRQAAVVAAVEHGSVHLPYRPSVDLLFESAAAAFGARVLGVVLTGMGDDGLRGARAIRAAGGEVIAESESSCIVDGMPRSVREAGLANDEAPLERMAEAIVRRLGGGA